MKKIIISLLVGNMLLLGACGGKDNQNEGKTTEPRSTVRTMNKKDCISICQNYLSKNNSEEVNTVKNWENPIITRIEKLPDSYYKISGATKSKKYFKVVFTTTDEILGSIVFFVDEVGNIIGQNYRK